MKIPITDQELTNRLIKHLDADLQSIDDSTLHNLRRCRQNALEQLEKRKRCYMVPFYWLTPTMVSTFAIALLAVSVWIAIPGSGHKSMPLDDLEVITMQENTDLVQNLDFYRWVAETNNNGHMTPQ